jgi:multiple sugar transport system substrate-binding protein
LGLLTAFLLVIALIFILYQPKVTLTFVVPAPEAPAWKPLIEEFQANNPGIHIEIVDKQDDEVETTYTSALGTANSPYELDLVYMDIIWVPKFAEKGWLMDLTEQFPNEKLDEEFLRGDVNGGRYQGKIYRIPFRSDVGVLYYRKDLLISWIQQAPKHLLS